MLLGNDTSTLQPKHHSAVCSCYLCVRAVLGGLHQYGIAINIYHDHDVLISSFGYGGELTRLVGKNCVANVVDFSVYVAHLLSSQFCCVCFIQRLCLGLG